jgi:hypothetical protein
VSTISAQNPKDDSMRNLKLEMENEKQKTKNKTVLILLGNRRRVEIGAT